MFTSREIKRLGYDMKEEKQEKEIQLG